MHHITVLDDVLFSLKTHLACFFGSLFAAIFDEVFIADHFGTE